MAQRIDLRGWLIDDDEDPTTALARAFCDLSGDEQAEFFNEVAAVSDRWDAPACFQWRSMQQFLTPAGKKVIDEMKDHTDLVEEVA